MIYYYVKWNITEPWDGVNDMKEQFKKKTEGESGGAAASLGGSTWYGVDKRLFVRHIAPLAASQHADQRL